MPTALTIISLQRKRAMFRKRVSLWSREPKYITFVSGKTYAPPHLESDGNYVLSTIGTDFHSAVRNAKSPTYVCKAVLCALHALKLMHDDHIWHLDAKATNAIICSGTRHKGTVGPTDFTFDGKWHCVAFIDYETLFAPLHVANGFSKDLFDQDARVLKKLGRKTFDEFSAMPPWKRDRADVYSFASSLFHGRQGHAMDALQRAVALIMGHIPTATYFTDENGKQVAYYVYLSDFEQPVVTINEALAHVARVHLPPDLIMFDFNQPPPANVARAAFELCNNSHSVLDNALNMAGVSKANRIAISAYLQ